MEILSSRLRFFFFQFISTLKKKYGCQQYIRMIRAIFYGSETDRSSKGRYPALGHFSFSNFFILLAEIRKNKNNGFKER